MEKPNSLREHLLAAVPQLKHNPDRLLIFVDAGTMRATAAPGLSFEYAYTLNLILTDFAGSPDAVAIPLFAWILRNQDELMVNPAKAKDSITFEVDVIDKGKVDFSLKLPLTERVIVKPQPDGSLSVTHPAEPLLTDHLPSTPMKIYAGDELIAEWTTAPPVGVDIETPHPGPTRYGQ